MSQQCGQCQLEAMRALEPTYNRPGLHSLYLEQLGSRAVNVVHVHLRCDGQCICLDREFDFVKVASCRHRKPTNDGRLHYQVETPSL